MRISYENLIDDITSTSMTALTTAAGYPIANVQDQRLTKKWKSDASTTQTVVIDLGSAQAVTAMAIVSHNIASTASIIVNANATDVWTAPSVIESLTWNSGMIIKFISSQSYRYWQFAFSGLTQAVSIGRLWLGTYSQIDPSSTDEFTVTDIRDDTVTYGKHRQKYASPGVGWRKIDLSFKANKTTAISVIRSIYSTVGKHSSWIFCNFDDLRSYPLVDPLYGSFSEDITFAHQGNQKYNYPISITEDL